jgi:hypothetical protein
MKNSSPAPRSKSDGENLYWFAAFIAWIIFVLAFYFAGGNWSKTGVFGDSFGVFNALVSALAAAAAYKAFLSQQQQVEDQKQEFLLQRKEQHLFSLMEEWRASVREVVFDNSTGQHALCRIENELLGAIVPLSDDHAITAMTAGNFIGKYRLNMHVSNNDYSGPIPNAKNGVYSTKGGRETQLSAFHERNLTLLLPSKTLRKGFREFYENQIGAILGHVFRIQSSILSYIDTNFDATSDHHHELQSQLIRLYKAQLSDPEMHLLLYYGLSHFADGSDLPQLLTKYRVFDALLDKGPEYIWHRIPEISYYDPILPTDR